MQTIVYAYYRCLEWVRSCFSPPNQKSKELEESLVEKIDDGYIELQQRPIHMIQSRKSAEMEGEKHPQYQTVLSEKNQQNQNKQGIRYSNRLSQSDSFVTIKSGTGSNPSIMRRTFRTNSQQRKKSRAVSPFRQEQYKSIKNDDELPQLSMIAADSKIDKLTEYFIEWNKREYLPGPKKYFNGVMNVSQVLKLRNNTLLDDMINQLENYYIFYLQQPKETSQFSIYYNKHFNLQCSYHLQEQNIRTSRFSHLITFSCNTEDQCKILRWYNSLETQAVIYSFYNIKLISNEEYPVLEVEQFGNNLNGKNVYTLVRQMEVLLDGEEEKEYVQLDTTMGKSRVFRSLLRFSSSEYGKVQIFVESGQEVSVSYRQYFQDRWSRLEGKLEKDNFGAHKKHEPRK